MWKVINDVILDIQRESGGLQWQLCQRLLAWRKYRPWRTRKRPGWLSTALGWPMPYVKPESQWRRRLAASCWLTGCTFSYRLSRAVQAISPSAKLTFGLGVACGCGARPVNAEAESLKKRKKLWLKHQAGVAKSAGESGGVKWWNGVMAQWRINVNLKLVKQCINQ